MNTDDVLVLREGDGPVVATAIHDGHALRPELVERIALDEATRLREEDPFTGRIAARVSSHLVALRSRFEADLNRTRDKAVYLAPEDAWGLEVWRTDPSGEMIERSLDVFDRFYSALERVLRERERRHGRFVVLDIHSYNHRREGPDRPADDPEHNPEINVGTGSVDLERWGSLVDSFCEDLSAALVEGHRLDVRRNVKFRGGAMCAFIHRTFPKTGCALAIEVKKTFMDEWTGEVDESHLAELGRAIASTLPGLERWLSR